MSGQKQNLRLKWIRLDKLNLPSPSLRVGINQKKFAELKKSIQSVGIKYPIVVRKLGKGEYAVVAGEQRVKVCSQSGYSPSYLLPCLEVDVDDPQAVEYGLIENLIRQELTPFEEANAVHLLVKRYNYKQQDIVSKLGKTKAYISEMLSIFALPKYILNAIRKGQITVAHGTVLVRLNSQPPLQKKVFMRIIEDKLSKYDTVTLVGLAKETKAIPSFYKPQVWRLEDGSRVRLEPRKTGVRVELYYNAGGNLNNLWKSVIPKINDIEKSFKKLKPA